MYDLISKDPITLFVLFKIQDHVFNNSNKKLRNFRLQIA